MAQTLLPPGFRFHPTDVELCSYYLKRKIMGKKLLVEAISEVELYRYAPWDLPDKSCLQSRDMEWYFFCPRDKKYANGCRTNRSTPNGFWKATGKDRTIVLNTRLVGMKRTLIFHEGKAPRGDRTDWVMYEYRMEDNELDVAGFSKDAYVLCKIFKKSGIGPKLGEQYGATFNEEEWDNVNTETAMFPLMPGPSSEGVGAANGSPVLQTVASTSSVGKEPHVLTVTSGDPFEFNSSAVTAIDELPHHTLRCNGSEMATASCASEAQDACDPTEFGGFSSDMTDEWVKFLSDSAHNDGDASEKFAGLPAISEAEAQALEMNSDFCHHELTRLVESGGVSKVNNLFPGYVNTECLNPPMVSGTGVGDDYLEISDLLSHLETTSVGLLAQDSLFPQYPLEQFPCNDLNCPQYDNDGAPALAPSLGAGDLLPPISYIPDDDITCTTNLVWNDISNSTMRNPFP